MEKKQSVGMKILSVIIGTLIGGFMFRCRGESGFGSSWGLYSVGLVLILLVFIFYGKRPGMKYERITLGAFLTGLGVTGYATVIDQLSGMLSSDTKFFFKDMPVVHNIFPSNGVILQAFPERNSELASAPISISSGMIIILFMGFTLVPFFSYFIGTLFSKKENKLQNYVIAVLIFFGVSMLAKATIAHPILKAINPEQVNYALLSLKDRGEDFSSMYQAYMSHFLDRDWTQRFQFVENYYMSIEHVSDVLGVLAITAYAFIRKDVVTGVVSILIDVFTSVSTTACSLIMVASRDTGVLADFDCPRAIADGGWGVWEFSTGAAIGFFTMLIIALLPNKLTAQSKSDNAPMLKNKTASFVYNFIFTTFIFAVVPFRAIGIRFNKLFKNFGLTDEGELYGTIGLIVASIIFGIIIIKVFYKNIVVLGDSTPFRVDTYRFSIITFSAYTGMCAIVYFFLNHACLVTLPYKDMTSLDETVYLLLGYEYFTTALMLAVFIIFAIIYYPFSAKLLKKEKISR